MSHFGPDFLEFFAELDENNSKAWFDKNRKRYEQEVKIPFWDFVALMIDLISRHDPTIEIAPNDAIFRINRDIRFSKDKHPYKVCVSANIARGGRKSVLPGFYFQLSHEEVLIGGGAHRLDAAGIGQVRQKIGGSLDELAALISDKEFVGKFKEVQGQKNKRIPKEFEEALAEQPLIANKQFFYMAQIDPKYVLASDLSDRLLAYYMAAKPLNDYLADALK